MKRAVLINISNFILAIYTAVWIYYAAFNWDVFSIKLNTNAGFSIIGGYPFVFFFLLGLVAILAIKYCMYLNKVHADKTEKESAHKIAIMEKDIEILKMKEVLFKMQTSEMGRNSSNLNALHEKLDSLSKQVSGEEEKKEEDKKEKNKETEKD